MQNYCGISKYFYPFKLFLSLFVDHLCINSFTRLVYQLIVQSVLPVFHLNLLLYYHFADAVRDISNQIPEDIQLYYFGNSPCSETSASNLIKELQRSPLSPSVTEHTKSNSGMSEMLSLMQHSLTVLVQVCV